MVIASSASTSGNADDREIAAPLDFCATLARKYENLFKRRFHIENEEPLCEYIATDLPQRNRCRIAGSNLSDCADTAPAINTESNPCSD